ncbi:MAG: hypothetical protein QM784_08810 [Polyangiaceae bacterium]
MREVLSKSVVAAVLVHLAVGCGGATKNFQRDGYYHEQYPFRVASSTTEQDGFLGPDWQLDNYQRESQRGSRQSEEGCTV